VAVFVYCDGADSMNYAGMKSCKPTKEQMYQLLHNKYCSCNTCLGIRWWWKYGKIVIYFHPSGRIKKIIAHDIEVANTPRIGVGYNLD
jgi:hypothetical protein